QELAKKRGRNIDAEDQVENELKRAEDELFELIYWHKYLGELMETSYDMFISWFQLISICSP
ncbi:hypothetical protein A2U01_0013259, partial [Trifolium medium]|nr:hypothetical protein [Trifolium medium]